MSPVARAFGALAKRGRLVLPLGLVAGAALPDLASAMTPTIPVFAATLLFLAALRIGPARAALGGGRGLARAGATVALLQLALPAAVAVGAAAAGLSGPLVGALTLMAAAPSIAGGPSIAMLAGGDPAPAMRLLVIGTAALPLTAPLVFLLAPALGDAAAAAAAAGRLALLIGGAVGAALALRAVWPAAGGEAARPVVEGLSVLGLAGMVIGLMAAVGPALVAPDAAALAALALAFAANFGLQATAWGIGGALGLGSERVGVAVVAGNRNMALFLAALPPAVTEPMLAFIGFYQIPMYLTPLLISALSSRRGAVGRPAPRR